MKNRLFIKIWTIAALLFSIVLFMDTNPTNTLDNVNAAGNSWSRIQLKINEWAITCTWWHGILNMWAVNAAFWAITVSWTYANNSWRCTDTKWSSARGLTVKITWDLIWPSPYTISSWNAFICLISWPTYMVWQAASPALTTSIPTCASTTWLVMIQDILRRQTANGQIYEYAATPRIWVNIPASQSPGTYTWTLELTVP